MPEITNRQALANLAATHIQFYEFSGGKFRDFDGETLQEILVDAGVLRKKRRSEVTEKTRCDNCECGDGQPTCYVVAARYRNVTEKGEVK